MPPARCTSSATFALGERSARVSIPYCESSVRRHRKPSDAWMASRKPTLISWSQRVLPASSIAPTEQLHCLRSVLGLAERRRDRRQMGLDPFVIDDLRLGDALAEPALRDDRHGDPPHAVARLHLVAVAPVVDGVLAGVVDDELVTLGHEVEVAPPRQVVRLQEGDSLQSPSASSSRSPFPATRATW